jgi:hypothetical protein
MKQHLEIGQNEETPSANRKIGNQTKIKIKSCSSSLSASNISA